MQITFQCPGCLRTQRATAAPAGDAEIGCTACDWTRTTAADDFIGGRPRQCLVCGNVDLWRQKDFPQRLGVAMVAAGAIGSSIAWYYHRPIAALAILMGFALVDMALYWLMPDVLVCYRCRARHHHPPWAEDDESFNHELAEKYRQEAIRLRAAEKVEKPLQ